MTRYVTVVLTEAERNALVKVGIATSVFGIGLKFVWCPGCLSHKKSPCPLRTAKWAQTLLERDAFAKLRRARVYTRPVRKKGKR